MSETPTISVLLLTDDAERARCWAEILPAPQFDTLSQPGDVQADVIVTDRAELDMADDPDAGVVRIGIDARADVSPPADVTLPADFAPRELQLTCRLLGEVVRLRRRVRWAAQRQRELSIAALTDALTGLPNRRAWEDALPRRVAMAAEAGRPLCLAIFDVDRFKEINDQHSHVLGDAVLRESARALGDSLRADDFLARLGGDEFGLLMGVRNEEVAAQIIERGRAAVASRLLGTAAHGVTISAGYHVVPLGGAAAPLPSPAALYAVAAAALHQAKQEGRNRSVRG
jgi:diguanylate cyclase (GGDEF)-like protein